MINKENWLVIGAADRNVGKTEFACALISSQGAMRDVYGVKITTIKERDGKCPRGGEGCGVCSSLGDQRWLITEEKVRDGKKDTVRMLRAGATKVFWLRVHQDYLHQGIDALLEFLPNDAPVVCESNSVRNQLQPGLFVLIAKRGAIAMKPSAQAVAHLADKRIEFFDNSWDVQPDEFGFYERWRHKLTSGAIILAGGNSQRMGQNKSLLLVGGKPMIAHIVSQLQSCFRNVILSTNSPSQYAFLQVPMVGDVKSGKGPLMGIYSALSETGYDVNFVTGCDIPQMNITFIEQMYQEVRVHDVVVPVDSQQRFEPLFAFYKTSALPEMKRSLDKNRKRIASIFDSVKTKTMPFPTGDWYHNLNTPEEFTSFTQGLRV